MKAKYNAAGPIEHIYGMVKVAILVSIFFQFGWVAGVMASFLVINVED